MTFFLINENHEEIEKQNIATREWLEAERINYFKKIENKKMELLKKQNIQFNSKFKAPCNRKTK